MKTVCTFTQKEIDKAMTDAKGVKCEAARALGIPATTLNRWLREGLPLSADPHSPKKEAAAATASPTTGSVRMKDILARFDPVQEFLKALSSIPKGEYLPDVAMQRLCNTSKAAWLRIKRNSATLEYRVLLPDRSVVWGSAQDAALLRHKLMEV